MRVAALTCTGGRPHALGICRKYIERQTRKPDKWYIVDDCEPETAVFGDVVIKPRPFWTPQSKHTLPRNMISGLEAIFYSPDPVDVVTIFEDDDWYHPCYLELMTNALNRVAMYGAKVIGEMNTVYYNVLTRTWKQNFNPTHASLCSVSMTVDAIPKVIDIIRRNDTPYIDLQIFREMPSSELRLVDTKLCIGIKGIPDNRVGVGGSHKGIHPSFAPDPGMRKLREFVGDDYVLYEGFFDPKEAEKLMLTIKNRDRRAQQKKLKRHSPVKHKPIKPILLNGPLERKKR